jgi:hypothetical protein
MWHISSKNIWPVRPPWAIVEAMRSLQVAAQVDVDDITAWLQG